MTTVPASEGSEVVLAASARALALVDEHARAWRRGQRLSAHLMLGATCPGCGRQVAAVVARAQTARQALAALHAAGGCRHPDADPDGGAAPSTR